MLPFNATAKQEYGAAVEEWVLGQLLSHGHQARLISRWGDAFDLVIDGPVPLQVEVKAARRRWRKVRPGYYSPEWRWHTANISQEIDHLLALVAEDLAGQRYLFLVPSWVAWKKQGLSITSHPREYRGRLACYLEAWAVVGEVAAQRRKHSNQIQLSFTGD